jgi:hypothetical protein
VASLPQAWWSRRATTRTNLIYVRSNFRNSAKFAPCVALSEAGRRIVTTNDPGNRITVFDNLPGTSGKWVSVSAPCRYQHLGPADFFTTSGELFGQSFDTSRESVNMQCEILR